MKPFEYRPFVKEDFSEAPWMERLIRPLNSVLTQVQSGISKGLTLGDNCNAEIKTLDVGGGKAAVAAAAPDTAWHNVGDPGEPAFNANFSNDTSQYEGQDPVPCRFRQIGGVVYVQLTLNRGTNGNDSCAFTLPVGYRPSGFFWQPGDGGAYSVVAVTPDGKVWSHYQTATPLRANFSFPADDYSAPTGTAATGRKDPQFTTSVKGKVAGVLVLGCVQIVGSKQIPVAVTGLAWEQNGATIILRGLGGLDLGGTYRLAVLVVGG